MRNEDSILLWFRDDLRIRDNAALAAAIENGFRVVPVFVWESERETNWQVGAASRAFLREAVRALGKDLSEHGLELTIRAGDCGSEIETLLEETGAAGVYWNRCYDPYSVKRDSEIKRRVRERGRVAESFNTRLLVEPWEASTQQGKPFQVFTPFWKRVKDELKTERVEVDLRKLRRPEKFPHSLRLEDLGLLPDHPWVDKVMEHWEVSETAAKEILEEFIRDGIEGYDGNRDIPSMRGTSRLSPYLHWGLIGPRQVWSAVVEAGKASTKGGSVYLKELGWREFAYHVLYHFPKTPDQPLREKYEDFPWEDEGKLLEAWQRGRTGYPIVDAGMRQLWEEGWMHNRVRMVVGSLLVKHLLHSWKDGARWFWDCLVDADLASNTLGWQGAGGCGADAAPYFRIFNPMTQGQKFDPEGEYVRRYVPELSKLPKKYIHEPWEAPKRVLEEAGIKLGEDYPYPIIEHKKGRERALAAFDRVKG